LCDEPFSALDELTGATLRREFQTLVRETTQTSLFITHSIREAIELGQRILVFRAPGHVALEIDVQQALAEHGESRLKEIILEAMGDKPAAPDIHPS
jgi:NitT/TauT family transport system ATP-binding protein